MDEHLADWEARLKDYLAAHGLRLTRQRQEIVEAFFESEGHPNIDELYARVRARDPRIGQATVYRTLKLLVDCGLANVSRFGGAATRYEVHEAGEHHDHLICTRCGTIIEFRNDTIERLQEEIAAAHDFEMDDHKMEIYGLCAKCR
jgi:Fur family ferric uptake transcriptional regulator